MAVTTKKREKTGRLSNYMEELTENVLDGLLSSRYKGARFSDGALQDIKALALNRLWPMYTTTPTGRQFLKQVVEEDKIEQDIVRELRAAIEKVKTAPRR